MIKEEIINFGENGHMCGILTAASRESLNNKVCIIFLNAGLIHKVGPNGIYKKLSGKYSQMGFASFRLDFSGLGDSQASSEKINNASGHVSEVKCAMDWLQENKGISQFLLTGICSGAKVAWDTSINDHRILGLCLIDGIFADEQLLKEVGWKADRHLRIRYYKKHMFSLKRWMKLLSGKSKLFELKGKFGTKQLAALIQKRINKLPKHIDERSKPRSVVIRRPDSTIHWEMLFERKMKVHLIFCEGGVAMDIFKWTLSAQLSEYNKRGLLLSTFVKDVDHTFTPVWSQDYLCDLTTGWLKREFNDNFLK